MSKRIFLLITFILVSIGFVYSQGNIPAFLFTANDVSGNKIDLSKEYKNKVIVINFWATWCPPCRHEIPDLINLYEKYKDKILLVGVSLDREKIALIKFMEKYKFNYPIIHDSNFRLQELYGGVYSIPTTIVINREGKIVERVIGARSFEFFEGVVKKYIGK